MNISQPMPFIPKTQARAETIAAQFLPLSDIVASLDGRYLVKGWIERATASVIYGESNVGKTFFAIDLAMRVAAGTGWHGVRVSGGHVIYVAGEGGGGIKNRIAAIKAELPELAACADGNFTLLPTALDLHGETDAAALIEAMAAIQQNPVLIVIDTLARAMGSGDENTAKDMGLFVQSVDAIRAATGAHVMVIHHSGKDAAKGARGSGSLRAAVDTEIELTRNGEVIVAATRKQRDMPSGAEFAYRLLTVELGQDADGEAVTSKVVERCDIPPKATKPLNGQTLIAMQAFGDALALHGEIKRGGDFPMNRQCVSLAQWRDACDRHSLTDGQDSSAARQAFGRAWKGLQERQIIRVLDGFAWRVSDA